MTDRVYPSTKPTPPPGSTTKPTHLHNPNRPRPPLYRPPQKPKRRCSCRKCCCLTIIYTLIALLTLLLLAGVGAAIFYFLYHPKHPTFSVPSLRISKFNLTQNDNFFRVSSHIDFTVTAKNPNTKKITFEYDPFKVSLFSDGVDCGNVSLPGFVHVAKNTTVVKGSVVSDPDLNLDPDSVKGLRSDLGKKLGFPIRVEVETKVRVVIGKLRSNRVGFRVVCHGLRGFQPKNAAAKTPTQGATSGSKCKVDLRVKIWKFTF